MDFVLSGYSYNKLNHTTIDYIISNQKLDLILDVCSKDNIGKQLIEPISKRFSNIKIPTLHHPKNYIKIEKKKYIVHSLYKDNRGFFCHDTQASVEGDKIIQIGVVFHDINNPGDFDKHILIIPYLENNIDNPFKPGSGSICTIKENIIDINKQECVDEEVLLYKFTKLIHEINPDIFTGYNIFGFDFDYMIKRASELWDKTSNAAYNFKYMFYDMGRLSKRTIKESLIKNETINSDIKNTDDIKDNPFSKYNKIQQTYGKFWSKSCRPVSKTLSSSGLGDNELVYINMDGRVIFDVQKEVQKNSK